MVLYHDVEVGSTYLVTFSKDMTNATEWEKSNPKISKLTVTDKKNNMLYFRELHNPVFRSNVTFLKEVKE